MAQKTGLYASRRTVQLILRGKSAHTLVSTPEEWRALGEAATRMLFWCGGAICGCRCEGNEIHFVVQPGNAALGTIAHHITATYSMHLRQHGGWRGSIFKHYLAFPLADEIYLDDLVLWLHRPVTQDSSRSLPRLNGHDLRLPKAPGGKPQTDPTIWTAEAAYLTPSKLPWIETAPVFHAMSPSATTCAALYRKRKAEPIPATIITEITRRRRSRGMERMLAHQRQSLLPSLETIVRVVAAHCRVSVANMRSKSRKRDASKAKLIAAVLCTRNGGSVAAVARLFGRSRSTLTERAEYYRTRQPELFNDAEAALNSYLNQKHR